MQPALVNLTGRMSLSLVVKDAPPYIERGRGLVREKEIKVSRGDEILSGRPVIRI